MINLRRRKRVRFHSVSQSFLNRCFLIKCRLINSELISRFLSRSKLSRSSIDNKSIYYFLIDYTIKISSVTDCLARYFSIELIDHFLNNSFSDKSYSIRTYSIKSDWYDFVFRSSDNNNQRSSIDYSTILTTIDNVNSCIKY